MKYSLSPREILRAKPEGFPDGLSYVSSYLPTLPSWKINMGRVDSPYCSDSWAIRENIAQ